MAEEMNKEVTAEVTTEEKLEELLKSTECYIPNPTVICDFTVAVEEGDLVTKYGAQHYFPGYYLVTTDTTKSAVAPQKFALTYTQCGVDKCFKSSVQKGVLIESLNQEFVDQINELSVDGTQVVKNEDGSWAVKTLETTGGVKTQDCATRYVLYFDVVYVNGKLGVGNIYPCSKDSFDKKYISKK